MEAYSPELVVGGIVLSAGGGATMLWGFASMFGGCEPGPGCDQQRSSRGLLIGAGAIAVVTGIALVFVGKERVPKFRHPGRSRRAATSLGPGAARWSF